MTYKTKTQTQEMYRTRLLNGLYVVEVLSHVVGSFIVVSEWLTEAEAQKDLESWVNS